MTYIKGGRVSNTDVIILYIHNLLLNLAYFQFHGEKGVNEKVWKLYFLLNPSLDFMEIELDNTRDKKQFMSQIRVEQRPK